MGIVNVTPDSFSDGGRFFSPEAAIRHAMEMASDGVDWIDIGAESSRPGSRGVSPDEEWMRLEPVLRPLVRDLGGGRISVDTRHPDVMRKAADVGVRMINNIAGVADRDVLVELASVPGMHYVAMHMQGSPETMQHEPLDGDQAESCVGRFMDESVQTLREAGFSPERIWVDPGIGFGKTDQANVRLLDACGRWSRRFNIVIGVSRKSFLGRLLGIDDPVERDPASKILELAQMMAGAGIIRTHDTKTLARLRSLLYDNKYD
jgi:dihydropteroate synthase